MLRSCLVKEKKKKKRRTDPETLSIGSLGRNSEGMISEIGRNSLSKVPLGPIGGTKGAVSDKQALPGIGGPKRSLSPPKTIDAQNPLRKSEVSALTSSLDSSDSGKDKLLDGRKRSSEQETNKSLPTADNTSSMGSGQRKSKMSSRLAAVVSDSGENQLPSPNKHDAKQKIGSIPLPSSAEAEAKEQSSGSKGPMRSSFQEKEAEHKHSDSASTETMSATSRNLDTERDGKDDQRQR